MCAKVLKSRYFEHVDFLQSEISKRPSFAWKSLLHGRDLLISDLKKMIGNGLSINVWSDPWIHDNPLRIPLMKNIFVDLNLKVSDLLDPISHDWNRIKLHDLFYPMDIVLIEAMKPIPSQVDFWIWKHTRLGDYSVKSGNWLANQAKFKDLILQEAALPSFNVLKEEIWSSQAPAKIKNFLWKALSGVVSVIDKILSKRVRVDTRCQTCGLEGESINHVLFFCSAAKQVWALSNVPWPEGGYNAESIFLNIAYILSLRKRFDIDIQTRRSIPWILWTIWKNRNHLFIQGYKYWPLDTMKKIRDETEEWFLAQAGDYAHNQAPSNDGQRSSFCWKPPPSGWLKCNVGSTWNKKKNLGGAAWVLRDNLGKVHLHSRRAFSRIKSKEEANLKVLIWVVDNVHQHHYDKVIFAFQATDLLGCLLRPQAWLSFKYQVSLLQKVLGSKRFWKQIEVHLSFFKVPLGIAFINLM